MDRRLFIKSLGMALVTPKELITFPTATKLIYDKTRRTLIPVSLYGIPYHQSNASTGEWLGISRA